MILTEFNEDVFVSGIRQEGRAEGRLEGRAEGRLEETERCIHSLMESIKCSREDAMRFLNVSE